MGRTVMAYSMQLQLLEKRLQGFRRALRKEDQTVFDEIMDAAKMQVQSGVMASSPNPADSVFLSVLIDMKKTLNRQGREIDSLKEAIESFYCGKRPD